MFYKVKFLYQRLVYLISNLLFALFKQNLRNLSFANENISTKRILLYSRVNLARIKLVRKQALDIDS